MKPLTWLVLLSIIVPAVLVIVVSRETTISLILLSSGLTIDVALLAWIGVYGRLSIPMARMITYRVCFCWIVITFALAVAFLAKGLHIL